MAKTGDWLWHELMTTDAAVARQFYAALLGWGTREQAMDDMSSPYVLWQHGNGDHGGMMQMEGPQWTGVPSHWMIYVTVDDVDLAADRVPKLGGELAVGPMDVPGVGRFCLIKDPTGAMLALMTPAMSSPPPQKKAVKPKAKAGSKGASAKMKKAPVKSAKPTKTKSVRKASKTKTAPSTKGKTKPAAPTERAAPGRRPLASRTRPGAGRKPVGRRPR